MSVQQSGNSRAKGTGAAGVFIFAVQWCSLRRITALHRKILPPRWAAAPKQCIIAPHARNTRQLHDARTSAGATRVNATVHAHNTSMVVLYPHQRVSEMQSAQHAYQQYMSNTRQLRGARNSAQTPCSHCAHAPAQPPTTMFEVPHDSIHRYTRIIFAFLLVYRRRLDRTCA